jgi:hypothetical protein
MPPLRSGNFSGKVFATLMIFYAAPIAIGATPRTPQAYNIHNPVQGEAAA